jgi:hypothetical protein
MTALRTKAQSGNDQLPSHRHDHPPEVPSVTLSSTRNSSSQPYRTPKLKISLGAEGGLGVMILLAITSAAVIRYFDFHPGGGESVWARMTAPALSAILLAGAVVLAVMHYGTLLGTAPGNPAAWLLPSAYAVAAAGGLCWGAVLRARRPQVYRKIGLGPEAATAPSALTTLGAQP